MNGAEKTTITLKETLTAAFAAVLRGDYEERDRLCKLAEAAFEGKDSLPSDTPILQSQRDEVEQQALQLAQAYVHDRGFGWYDDPMEGGQDAYDICQVALEEARTIVRLIRTTTENKSNG